MKSRLNKRWVMLIFLVGLLVGAVAMGMLAFSNASVSAQTSGGDNGEREVEDAEDSVEGPDVAITGTALEQASAAALAYMGEGRVTGTEVGDEEGYYEIEIRLDNGRQVDVHLDENFTVLGHLDD